LTSAECFDSSPAGERTEDDPTSLSVESEEEDANDVTGDEERKNDNTATTHTTLEAEAARYFNVYIVFVFFRLFFLTT
jgi:hypothetical protein